MQWFLVTNSLAKHSLEIIVKKWLLTLSKSFHTDSTKKKKKKNQVSIIGKAKTLMKLITGNMNYHKLFLLTNWNRKMILSVTVEEKKIK